MSINTGNNPRRGGNYLKRATDLCVRAGLKYIEPFIKDVGGNYCNLMTIVAEDTIYPFYVVARGKPYMMGEHKTLVVSVAKVLHIFAKLNKCPIIMAMFWDGADRPRWYCFDAELCEIMQLGENDRGMVRMVNFPLDSGEYMASPIDVVHHHINLHRRREALEAKGTTQSSLGRWG